MDEWLEEEDASRKLRNNPGWVVTDRKWSEGSSPVILKKVGPDLRPDYKKCFWYHHPSSARCFECPMSDRCDHFVTLKTES